MKRDPPPTQGVELKPQDYTGEGISAALGRPSISIMKPKGFHHGKEIRAQDTRLA